MRVVVVPGEDGGGRAVVSEDAATGGGGVTEVADLAGWMGELERRVGPRWVVPSLAEVYPALLRAGVRLGRCHDLGLAEAILLAFEERPGRPRNVAAAWARPRGLPEPEDAKPQARGEQPALFEADRRTTPAGADPVAQAVDVLADQERRIAGTARPDLLRLLVAAESAGGLAAAEMTHFGLPWRVDVHLDLLVSSLGPRPAPGARPARLAELAARISAAFSGRPINPDHPPSIVKAFAREGIEVDSARAWVLKGVEHPAVEPLLAYKELARLWVAHGWSWLESWVEGGRFRPDYVVGGVVSGRWATRGGAALQLPKVLRTAVRADPGWALVVADAAQLEPRVLGALSGDPRFAEVAAGDDLYAGVAADAFDGDRDRAKTAMLSAMYGGTSGPAGALLAVLRKRFPVAVEYVEQAARVGEAGQVVRSRLGRTSPPPSEAWRERVSASGDEGVERRARQAARDWGRFTRNFVVQASAADWALAMLASLRRRLLGVTAEIVFFQHDEVIVHCPAEVAPLVAAEVEEAALEASRLVFAGAVVQFPLAASIVDSYADAK
ncbi:bifunctional 3'-5' exonuclease/DNA polymerase [Actinokineospora sp. PR83]|uniref:bifunctional 3'-5' exonuclease/DNA polymerase n=1 Tax=Actinokineospora sp. PR83 TaxID=2884908 RepID=UPI001F28A4BD|nr:bifunctional 3'-5' exonuclease/DNA polymerase [Actinokineospora sp. PR83]MCG8917134.1 bifunctional 3'-5' exonuclease/DNA polymerase [Actinokineospora sp. PR83]